MTKQITILYLLLFFLILFLTPLVKRFSEKYSFGLAKTGIRKIHQTTVSQLGGLSIYISFVLFFFALVIFEKLDRRIFGIFFATSLIFAVGAVDDIKDLSPKIKLLFQILSSILLFFCNVKVQNLSPFISFAFTVLWIIGITNSINLIDGVDGLSCGITVISALFFAFFCKLNGFELAYLLSLFLIITAFGFLFFNFPPASIFLGDSGAYLLGMLLSVVVILSFFEKISLPNFISVVLILSVPIFDTCFAIVRRIYKRRKIDIADREHIHHKLLNAGFSARGVIAILWSANFVCGVIGIIVSF